MSTVHVVLADPLPIFRAGVRNLLTRESGFRVSEAADASELMRIAATKRPQVALVDVDLPPRGGLVAVRRLAREFDCRPIVWGFSPTSDAVFAAVRAGASGFLHKEISPPGLVRALRGLGSGEAPISRDLAALLVEALHSLDKRDRARQRAALLSTREREVLKFVARGAANKEIAAALFISEFTVKRHIQNILQKLDVSSRRAAAAFYDPSADGGWNVDHFSSSETASGGSG